MNIIESLSLIDIEKNKILVLKFPNYYSQKTIHDTLLSLKKTIPDKLKNKVLIVANDIEVFLKDA